MRAWNLNHTTVICAQRYKRWYFPLHFACNSFCVVAQFSFHASLLLVPAMHHLQLIEAHNGSMLSADLRCRQCKKLCRRLCKMV